MASRLIRAAGTAAPVLIALTACIVLWEVGVWLFKVPPFVLPAPSEIARTAALRWPVLSSAASLTATEIVLGFLAGALVGVALAIAMVLVPALERMLLPVLIALNSVPSVAFVPLALLWFGLGAASKIALAAFAVAIVVLLNALQGLKRPDAEAIGLLRSFGAGRLAILRRLQLPAAMPLVVTGLRVGLGRAAIAVIVAEMLGAYAGLGQVIYQATAMMNSTLVWAGVLAASLTSLALYGVLVLVDRKFVWWR